MTVTPSLTGSRLNRPMMATMIAVAVWGFGPLSVRGVSASAATIGLYRFLIALPVFWIIAYATGGRVSKSLLLHSLAPGLLFGVSFITSFESFQRTSIANATLIGALSPLIVLPVAALGMGERLGWRRITLGAVALAGVAMTVLGAAPTSGATLQGDLLAVVTVVVFSSQMLLVKRWRTMGVHSWSAVAAVSSVAFLVVAPRSLLMSDDLGAIGGHDWTLLVLMVLGPGLLGHGLMTWAQGHVDASLTAILMLASPVLSAIGAWLIFSQALSIWQIIGAGVVLTSLAGVVLERRLPGVKLSVSPDDLVL